MFKKKEPFTLSENEVIKSLDSSFKGLTSKEAKSRLNKFGLNELKRKKKISPILIFLKQFNNILIWILIGAVIISFILNEKIDGIVILVILIFNATFGFIQEYKAEKAIEALKKLTALQAKVIRNKETIIIPTYEIVPGDILILSEGDKVPADARIIECHSLETIESSLTGESLPILKSIKILKPDTSLADRINMVYSGTIITQGKAKAIVIATGMRTEIGKIASMLEKIEEPSTPLQKKLKTLGNYLVIGTGIATSFVFVLGLIQGEKAIEMLLTSVALAVAAIPESLPAVVTISLALAIQRLIKKNSLIRKLPSIETLGSTTIICTDKTGTLTMNKMTVMKIYTNRNISLLGEKNGNSNPLLFEIGALCNDSELGRKNDIGDPTEIALLLSSKKYGINKLDLEKKYPRLNEIPFSSERKYMITHHKIKGKDLIYIKGAPDIILKKCTKMYYNGRIVPLNKKERDRINEVLEDFSDSALRVLGFAYKEVKTDYKDIEDLIFVGLQGMRDPPRKEVKDAIKKCKIAGIKVVMITGDYKNTAVAIGKEIGIVGKVITGQELDQIKDLSKIIDKISIYARVNPQHKLKIIDALKKKGHIVAMTGDGVNDAPALKKADIGIAMSITGTDVSKEASDMILVDDNFATIVNSIEEGRGVFNNLRKFVGFLLSCNIGEVLIIFFASLFGWPLPLIAIQILWINLVTDGPPAIALGLDPIDSNIMQQNPRDPKENIINKPFAIRMISLSILVTVITLFLFKLFLPMGVMKAQTIAFTTLVLLEMVVVYVVRGHYTDKILSNKYLIGTVILSIILQSIIIYTPLSIYFKVVPLTLMEWMYIISATTLLAILGVIIDKIVDKMSLKHARQKFLQSR